MRVRLQAREHGVCLGDLSRPQPNLQRSLVPMTPEELARATKQHTDTWHSHWSVRSACVRAGKRAVLLGCASVPSAFVFGRVVWVRFGSFG